MRFLSRHLAIVVFSCFPTITLASELIVKVVDPSEAPVFGAQVELFGEHSSRPIAMNVTSAQGIAQFNPLADSAVEVRVLAAGFAALLAGLSGKPRPTGWAALGLLAAGAAVAVVASISVR